MQQSPVIYLPILLTVAGLILASRYPVPRIRSVVSYAMSMMLLLCGLVAFSLIRLDIYVIYSVGGLPISKGEVVTPSPYESPDKR
jgi:hypothetical protein